MKKKSKVLLTVCFACLLAIFSLYTCAANRPRLLGNIINADNADRAIFFSAPEGLLQFELPLEDFLEEISDVWVKPISETSYRTAPLTVHVYYSDMSIPAAHLTIGVYANDMLRIATPHENTEQTGRVVNPLPGKYYMLDKRNEKSLYAIFSAYKVSYEDAKP